MRAAREWTQQELADLVGVSRQSITAIATRRARPSRPLARPLPRFFDWATHEIFTLEKKR